MGRGRWWSETFRPSSITHSHTVMDAHRYLLAIVLFIWGVGDAEIETHKKLQATGSSVLFPGLKNGTEFLKNMIYELRRLSPSPGWLMMDHGEPKVHKMYETRGKFILENKSFLLTNLTKEDTGLYEQRLNQKPFLRLVLTVIDPVETPVLTRQKNENGTCRITLLCAGRKEWNTTFSRDGEKITSNLSSISSDHLVIDGTDPQQWGTYTCTVTNPVSERVSQELKLITEEVSGALLFFYVSCIGGLIYIYYVICQLYSCKDNITPHVGNILFFSKSISGVGLELIVLSIVIYLFHDHGDPLCPAVIIVSISVLLIRVWWSLMFCGVPLPSLTVRALEMVLQVADLLLVPAILTQYIRLYLQVSDLCGIQREQGLRMFLYLGIGFLVILAVLLPLRIRMYVNDRTLDQPDTPKGPFLPTPGEETTDNISDDERRNEEHEKQALTEEETPT